MAADGASPEAGPDGQAGDVPLAFAICLPSESISCDSATYSLGRCPLQPCECV